ncbi:MAG: hypothetical protein IJZ03_02225 [Clostridia bacterium]|nr:hypothetical protein [Clostridia bacterium]MBQ9750733.1 hypothetical protein [Clostridia bacterium]
MSIKDISALLIALFLGGGGSMGIGIYFIKRAIEQKLSKYEKEAREIAALKRQLEDSESRLHHAYGRMFFWIYRAITTGKYSHELDKAFSELEDAESLHSQVEREIITLFSSEK